MRSKLMSAIKTFLACTGLIFMFCCMFSFLSGCGMVNDMLSDGPKKTASYSAKALDLKCLNVLPSQLQLLFNGGYTSSDADQQQVRAIWSCLDSSLNTFSSFTQGANPGFYTAAELQQFANRYLNGAHILNDEFTRAIFRMKKNVLGGTDTELTRDEIVNLRKKLLWFGDIILPLSPYLNTLLKPSGSEVKNKTEASKQLNKFVLNLAELLGDSKNPMGWNDLDAFIRGLEIYTSKGSASALTVVREQLQIYQYFKLLLVGGDEFAIEKEKWSPIFKSISQFYNALYLSVGTTQVFEELNLEIQSTESEQKRAVEKITGLLKVLKAEDGLSSKKTITLISDRWAKVLLLNAALFPATRGSIALKNFLDSKAMRTLAGKILDNIQNLPAHTKDTLLIQNLAENVSSLIEQAAVSGATSTTPIPALSLNALKDYAGELKPLLEDPAQHAIIIASIDALKSAGGLLIGKDSDTFGYKDLKSIISKTADLYLTWLPGSETKITEAVGNTVDIILQNPSPYFLRSEQFFSAVNDLHSVVDLLKIKIDLNWESITNEIKGGFKAKAILFANADNSISNYELRQLSFYWDSFRKTDDLAEGLAILAHALQNNPFSAAKLDDVLSSIDAFLPQGKKIKDYGFSNSQIGSLKAILIGGNNSLIDRNEYAEAANLASALIKNLKPITNRLPKNFKMGLNSQTMELGEAGLQSLIDARPGLIALSDLQDFLFSYLTQKGDPIHAETLTKALVGLNFRVFDGNKGEKPVELTGGISADGLKKIKIAVHDLSLSYADLEQVYAGKTQDALPKALLLERLKQKDNVAIVNNMLPILNGVTGMPELNTAARLDPKYYSADLNYKSLMYHVISTVFPAYQIEPDDSKLVRLSHNDLVDLLNDINDLIFELKMSFSNKPPELSASSRMQTINLFTTAGNGDEYIDLYETIEFLTLASGGKVLLEQIRKDLVKNCYPGVKDYEKVVGFSYDCLNQYFFDPDFFARNYATVAPGLVQHYRGLSADDREHFRMASLTAARPTWPDETTMELADLETLVSVAYYSENIFLHLDADRNNVLNFSEAMSGFPVFCGEIKKAGGPKIKGSCTAGEDPGQIEAIFGYLLFYGEAPRGIKPGDSIVRKIKSGYSFLKWARYWSGLDRDPEVRNALPPFLYRKDLLNIISNLSTTIAPAAPGLDSQKSDDPSTPKPPGDAPPGSP